MSKESSVKAMADLPPVLRTGALDRPYNQRIDTDILRPVTINQKGCRFVFNKTGVLDSNTQLNLAQIVRSTQTGNELGCYLPTASGALAMVARCFMTIGGKTISDLRDLGHYGTYHRLAFSNEYKKGIIMPKQGGNDVFQGSIGRDIIVDDGATKKRSRGFDAPFGVLSRPSSEYAVPLSYADQADVDANFGRQNADATDTTTDRSRILTRDADTTPEFAVGLAQLVPFLKAQGGIQIPLGLIQEEVAINIEWADGKIFGNRFFPPQTDTAGNPINADDCFSEIVTEKVFMMVDYLYYPEDMGAIAQEMTRRGGFNIPYTEVLTSERTVNVVAGDQTVSINLAFSGKRVKNVIIQKQVTDGNNLSVNNVGVYNSLAWLAGEAYNLQINSRNFYSRRIDNVALQKHELDMATGIKCKVAGARYSWNGNYNGAGLDHLMSDRLTNTYQNDDEEGTQHWLGIKVQNADGQGVRLSNVPMNYSEEINVQGGDNTQRKYRFFVGCQRVVNMNMGLVTVIE
tara:strand:+ start:4617 stop:6161 length:1545 start_codon:yes stop_codon:yes gene_type:complete